MTWRTTLVRASIAASTLTIVALALAGRALANGGTVRISNERTGPYDVTVFTDPSPLQAGPVDVSVMVLRAGTDVIVGEASILITPEPLDGQPGPGTYPATREAATNKLLYATKFSLPSPGRWRFVVAITSEDGVATTSFDADAEPPDSLRLILGLSALAVVVVGPIGWRLFRRSRARTGRARL